MGKKEKESLRNSGNKKKAGRKVVCDINIKQKLSSNKLVKAY